MGIEGGFGDVAALTKFGVRPRTKKLAMQVHALQPVVCYYKSEIDLRWDLG